MDIKEKAEKAHEKAIKKAKKEIIDENGIFVTYLQTPEHILEQIKNSEIANGANGAISNIRSQFIIYNIQSGTTEVKEKFEYQNRTYYPVVSKLIDQNVILLPTGIEDYGSTDQLVKEIKEFLLRYFEVPKFFESLLPCLILFYWVYEKFPFIPYIQFLGRTGTGKTTAMEVLGSICYKPIDASGSITMSAIFRIASVWHGTLMLDEFNPGGETYSEMLSLLKSGVSNKAVLRVEGDRKREVEAYMVKSPKIFTSENPVNDAGFRSRIIEIKMEQSKREIPLYKDKSYEVDASHLRNKLLLWRFHNLVNVDVSKFPKGFPELKSFNQRVQQVITPIYYLAGEEARKEIVMFAKEQQEETLRERREALDGQMFDIILENMKGGALTSLKDLTEKLNKNLSRPISERKTGNVIRKILGFEVEKVGHENIRTIITDKKEEKIEELCNYYGISLPSFKVAQVATVAQAQKSEPRQGELEDIDQENPFE